ncbi:hypothetical protein [Halolamina salifodinae]|uniref:Uncharacterized protein n=1 Tax=Halolamina salifodinae TaxID=1202767 RepID=A0A8T4H393_9EURY|nr:hypothetical protein [Halolamina salifodinae]MBP1988095.1 hypothetical protein [Halolamina salifodinae]
MCESIGHQLEIQPKFLVFRAKYSIMVYPKSLAVGGLAGVAVAGVNYVEGLESVQLLVCLGAVWAIAGWSLTQNRRNLHPSDTLHQLLFALLVAGIPPFTIHADLPLGGFRVPLMFLATGVAAAGIGLGAGMSELSNKNRTESPTVAD